MSTPDVILAAIALIGIGMVFGVGIGAALER
jgi:hypothetical protein